VTPFLPPRVTPTLLTPLVETTTTWYRSHVKPSWHPGWFFIFFIFIYYTICFRVSS